VRFTKEDIYLLLDEGPDQPMERETYAQRWMLDVKHFAWLLLISSFKFPSAFLSTVDHPSSCWPGL